MTVEIDERLAAEGAYCHKHVSRCFCAVGWPYERQCPACRDRWPEGTRRDSYCICPPDEVEDPPRAEAADWAVLVEVNRQIREARALRREILGRYGLDPKEARDVDGD
jgi:hypothetical protein